MNVASVSVIAMKTVNCFSVTQLFSDFGKWICVICIFIVGYVALTHAFTECQDDPTYDPAPGLLTVVQFTWLGLLQYIHIKNGTPHYFRVPRVVLITRNFAVCTAADAGQVPQGYALGNVIFGDYERDEDECRISEEDLSKGALCEPALLLMPISDVLLHPEFKNFKIQHSIALLRLVTAVKSKYMVPVCLPHKDYTHLQPDEKNRPEKFYHVDFVSDVPRDFTEEDKDLFYIAMLPYEKCFLYDDKDVLNETSNIRESCSSGCGLRSGAPTIMHEHTGHWTLLSLARGGPPCPDPLRPRSEPEAPTHTLIYPYLNWITTAIAGRSLNDMTKLDPFGYVMLRTTKLTKERRKKGWIGKWWMGGIRCYDRGVAADKLFRFYHEVFMVQPDIETGITYYIEIDAPVTVSVVCVKIGVPYRLADPTVFELDSPSVKVRIVLKKFYVKYTFEVEAWGYQRQGDTHEEE